MIAARDEQPVQPASRTGEGAETEQQIEIQDLVVRYGAVKAVNSISFTVSQGELLTLLGPSGCGKTTTLRAIAGLEQPASGEIRIGSRAVFSSSKRINVPTEKRAVSMVFQSYAIWPHMSVFDNVAYGLRLRRLNKWEVQEKVQWALDLVRMGNFATRSATKLSGGQQQRVALARAFVFSPSVLLLDEPLSNLDARLRAEMRVEIRELQRKLGITAIYVTHDQEEALAISDRIIVMKDGVIEHVGLPDEIYDNPRNSFIANFIGSANLIDGTIRRDLGSNGFIPLETPDGQLIYGIERAAIPGDHGVLVIRTAYPVLSRKRPESEINSWQVRIRRRIFLGDVVQYIVDWEGRELVVRRLPSERYDDGEQVYLTVDPSYCTLMAD